MIFNSLIFIVFLAVVLAVYYLPLSWKAKKIHLWIASYIFYMAWNPPFVVLLWISTLVDWQAGRAMGMARSKTRRRVWLVFSLLVNLGLLGYFKYGDFLLDNFTTLLEMLGIRFQAAAADIVLPVGISFYTFQSLSYSIDIYRGNLKPWDSLVDFAMYVTFFPQLVAGPIVRAADFLPQLEAPRRASGRQFGWGLSLLGIGLFQKIILADSLLAPVAETVYSQVTSAGTLDVWLGTLAFSAQIFFDFSGYSNCAIGTALCLGFVLPDNFRHPYASKGFADFWRRWHVSLSSWLRDYLYIPLGGNRRGPRRTLVNLMITMLLGGLWHGAAWHFIVWGGLHGLYLMGDRGVRYLFRHVAIPNRASVDVGLILLTYFLLCLSWVLFRARDFGSAAMIFTTMFNPTGGTLVNTIEMAAVLTITTALLTIHYHLSRISLETLVARMHWWLRGLLLAGVLVSLAFAPGEDRAFIYFQF